MRKWEIKDIIIPQIYQDDLMAQIALLIINTYILYFIANPPTSIDILCTQTYNSPTLIYTTIS